MPKRTTKAGSKPTSETDDAVLRDITAAIAKLKVPIDAFVIGPVTTGWSHGPR